MTENRLASQKGICSMEYVSEFVTKCVASKQCSKVPTNVLTNQLHGKKRTRIYLNFLGI
jgi:hypothetical protein